MSPGEKPEPPRSGALVRRHDGSIPRPVPDHSRTPGARTVNAPDASVVTPVTAPSFLLTASLRARSPRCAHGCRPRRARAAASPARLPRGAVRLPAAAPTGAFVIG